MSYVDLQREGERLEGAFSASILRLQERICREYFRKETPKRYVDLEARNEELAKQLNLALDPRYGPWKYYRHFIHQLGDVIYKHGVQASFGSNGYLMRNIEGLLRQLDHLFGPEVLNESEQDVHSKFVVALSHRVVPPQLFLSENKLNFLDVLYQEHLVPRSAVYLVCNPKVVKNSHTRDDESDFGLNLAEVIYAAYSNKYRGVINQGIFVPNGYKSQAGAVKVSVCAGKLVAEVANRTEVTESAPTLTAEFLIDEFGRVPQNES